MSADRSTDAAAKVVTGIRTWAASGGTGPGALAFDHCALLQLAESRGVEFRTAEPFPHIVIDGFLPESVIRLLIDEFPAPDDVTWRTYATNKEVKLALEDEALIPAPHVQVLRVLNSQVFIDFLEKLSGISGLIPDPHLRGAGIHQILTGGMLKVHADFDLHPLMLVHRRINVILYLNEDWADAYGGKLELWDEKMTGPLQSIAPVANRLLVFLTTDRSYHGHPDPLACPPDRSRKSMAWYFYTSSGADVASTGHSTIWRERPGEKLVTARERLRIQALSCVPASAKAKVKHLLGR